MSYFKTEMQEQNGYVWDYGQESYPSYQVRYNVARIIFLFLAMANKFSILVKIGW